MPGRDGTGPQGAGPMTGWGMGNCAVPLEQDASFSPQFSRGLGRGFGRGFRRGYGPGYGRGFRNSFEPQSAPVMSKQDQLQALYRQSEILKSEMSVLQKDIERLESQKKD